MKNGKLFESIKEFSKLAEGANLKIDDWVIMTKSPYILWQIKSIHPMGKLIFAKMAPYDPLRGRTWRTVLYKDQMPADYSLWAKKHGKSIDEMDQLMDSYVEDNGGWESFEWIKPMSVPVDLLEKVEAPK